MSFGKYDSEYSALKALAFACGTTMPDGGWDSSYSIMASMYEHLVGTAPAEGVSLMNMVDDIQTGVESGEITVSYDCMNEINRLNMIIDELENRLDECGGQGVIDSSLESIGVTPETQPYYFYSIRNAVEYAKSIRDSWDPNNTSMIFLYDQQLRFMPYVDTSNVSEMSFAGSVIETVPVLNLGKVQNAGGMFSMCGRIGSIPDLNFSNDHLLDVSSMFMDCKSLYLIPNITGTKNVINFSSLYARCPASSFPSIDTSSAKSCVNMYESTNASKYPDLVVADGCDCSCMYMNCGSLQSAPKITGKVISATNMFSSSGLINMPYPIVFDDVIHYDEYGNPLSAIAQMMFSYCTNLIEAPALDLSHVTDVSNMFNGCSNLKYIPDYNLSSINGEQSVKMFDAWWTGLLMDSLTDLDGFTGLRVGWTEGFLDKCPNLTVESLVNVFNKLEDVSDNPQNCCIGEVNVAKLTPEQIQIATSKGWNVF